MFGKKQKMCNKKQAGFTLFELMLVVGVGAVLLLGIVQITDMWARYLKTEQAGEHMETIRKAADEFLRNTSPAELNNITVNLNQMYAISNNGISSFDTYLPTMTNPLRNPIGRDLTVLLRRTQTAAPVRTYYEVYIITTGEPILNKMLLSAAHAVGAYGGIISQIRNPGTISAESLFGTWNMDAARMTALGGFIDLNPATSTEVTADGGQMMVYFNVSPEEVPGPYLYRVPTGNIDHNTMSTALIMGDGTNNNNIANAGDIDADSVTTRGNADVDGNLDVAGNGEITGNLSAGSFVVDGAATVNGNLSLNGTNNNVTGNITADHIMSATIETPTVNTTNFGAQNITVLNGLAVNAERLSVTNPLASLTVDGTLQVDSLSTGSSLTVGGNIITGGMEVRGGGVNITGNMNLGGDAVVENIAIDNCLRITGPGSGSGNYGNCP